MIITEIMTHNSPEDPNLYISGMRPIEYECDGKSGFIHFDGYYYIENHPPPYSEDEHLKPWERPRRYSSWLPKTLFIQVTKRQEEPYKEEVSESGVTTRYYDIIEQKFYQIEIYKKEVFESTDKISENADFDEDGEPIHICFFPTNIQKVYFRVLETLT